MTFQKLIDVLQNYWSKRDCVILQPYDMPMGAATFHPATFLRAIGPEPWNAAYVQSCRRPSDGRFGENPNRLQHYFQFQGVMKPSPQNIQNMFLDSLKLLKINPRKNDIRFVEDNWESPTLGAWGLGWEVQLNGMEISQFTYFQQIGGLDANPVTGELTYGLERIAMFLQDTDDIYNLVWSKKGKQTVTYGDIYHQNEVDQSAYNFEHANTEILFQRFEESESECKKLLDSEIILPAYEHVLYASHIFNILDARNALSVTERQSYILRIRDLAQNVASSYFLKRKALGFPMAKTK